MRKVFRLEDLDCANCAAKMENGARKIDGVEEISISFMTQRMTLTAPDERFDEVLKAVKTLCKRVEPDCRIVD